MVIIVDWGLQSLGKPTAGPFLDCKVDVFTIVFGLNLYDWRYHLVAQLHLDNSEVANLKSVELLLNRHHANF